MANEYLVPLGLDSNNLMKGLNETLSSLDEVEDKASGAGKTIEDAFGRGAKAADTFEAGLKPVERDLASIREASETTGKSLRETFDLRKASKDFSNQVAGFKKQLKDVTDRQRIGLEIDPAAVKNLKDARDALVKNFDDIQKTLKRGSAELTQNVETSRTGIAQIKADMKDLEDAMKGIAPGVNRQEMETELAAIRQALDEETASLEFYENQLKQVNTANKDLVDTLQKSNVALDAASENATGLGSSFEEVYGDLQPLTTRLGELEDRMYEMALAGQQNTQEFKELQSEAIKYRQTIQQVDAAVDTFAKRSAVLDIAVEAAQGLTGAFAAVQGAAALFGDENEEVAEALLRVNAAMSVLQGVQAVAAVLNKESAISAALFRTGLVQQATATDAVTAATTRQTVATRVLGVAFKALGIGLVVSLIAALVAHWDDVTAAINKLLPAGAKLETWFDRIKSVAVGVGNVLLQYLVSPFRALGKVIEGDFKGALDEIVKGYNVIGNFNEGYRKQEQNNEENHLREMEKKRIEADTRELQRRKNRGEDVTQQEIALQRRRLALQEQGTKDYTETLTTLEDMEDAHHKTMSDKRKTAATEATKQAEENHKKRIEAEQKANEQILLYATALEDARIAAIQNAGERERAQITADYDRRIEELKKQIPLTAQAQQQQTDLIIAMTEERNRRIEEMDKNEAQERIALRLEAMATLHELQKESMQQELDLLAIDHEQRLADINEQYKEEEDLRVMLVAALEQSTARERQRIQKEWGEEMLKEEEKRQILAIETASIYAKRTEQTERQKQIAILETKVEFSKRYMDALVASGAAENSVEVMQARKTVQDLQNELQDAITSNKGKGFDFFEFIGLGDLTGKERDAVKAAGKQIADSIGQITDFIIDQYDRQIEKRQEVIDSLGDEIDELEDKLDDERSLRDAGYANNVAVIEAELAEKKKQQEEEIKMQEEMQKKKEGIQKAQMAADTAMQLVNLITASTSIFKALAGIPFIGIPLAIATIGTMFGAFVGAKIKAAQAIQQGGQSYGEGGWIDGKPHSQGGKKYYSDTGEVRELEKDEFVVRKKVAKKHGNFLEALNSDKLSAFDINDDGLRDMLHQMGITFMDDSAKEGLEEARDLDRMRQTIIVKTGGNERELREMNENIKYLAQKERDRITSWEDEKYIYKKQGNRVTRILKPEFSKDGKDS